MSFSQIRLSQGLYALVDEKDFEYLTTWKWSASLEGRGTKWYAVRWQVIDGKKVKIRMHRHLMEHHNGRIPQNYVVDHVNHNSLDNRTSNLEMITQYQNMRRSPGWRKKGQKYKTKGK